LDRVTPPQFASFRQQASTTAGEEFLNKSFQDGEIVVAQVSEEIEIQRLRDIWSFYRAMGYSQMTGSGGQSGMKIRCRALCRFDTAPHRLPCVPKYRAEKVERRHPRGDDLLIRNRSLVARALRSATRIARTTSWEWSAARSLLIHLFTASSIESGYHEGGTCPAPIPHTTGDYFINKRAIPYEADLRFMRLVSW
jgi:hypothetical protein